MDLTPDEMLARLVDIEAEAVDLLPLRSPSLSDGCPIRARVHLLAAERSTILATLGVAEPWPRYVDGGSWS